MVDDATGRGDDDVDAGAQRLELHPDGLPTVHGEHARAIRLSVPVHSLGDLHGELSRGNEHEGANGAGSAAVGRSVEDALQHWERERGGLAGAGRCLAEDVAPFEEQRHRLALNGRGLFVAEGRERRDYGRAKAEGGESLREVSGTDW
jgi:hypothetical protein